MKRFDVSKQVKGDFPKIKKKYLVGSLIIFVVLTLIGVSFASYTTESGDFVIVNSKVGDFVVLVVLVDGVEQDVFPTKESGYVFESVSCESGSTGTWDSDSWELNLNEAGADRCTVSFVTATLANVCINQSVADCINENGMTYSSHEMVNDDLDGNIRYIGVNPNNYVTFNGESWRIIGVFDVASVEGGVTEKRVKLIRSDRIGAYSWDSSDAGVNSGYGVNEWSQADVMTTLNDVYYNRTSGSCYNSSGNSSTTCNFSSAGLTSDAKALIGDAYWHIGTVDGIVNTYNEATIPTMYESERSTNTSKICSSGTYCNDTVTRTTGWVGKVGLMYPSDYGYSTSGGEMTDRETCLNTALYSWGESGVSDCKNNSWLYNSSSSQWTITPVSYSSRATYVFAVASTGGINNNNSFNAYGVRPVVYLSANVKIAGGDGTLDNPFSVMI